MTIVLELAGFAVLTLMVLVVLMRAFRRAQLQVVADPADRAMLVYRDQLREVERDLTRGTIGVDEAERIRLEVSRRILDLDKINAARPVGGPAPRALRFAALGVVIGAVLLSAWLYLTLGAPGYRDMPLVDRHAQAADQRANRPRQAELQARFAEALPPDTDFPGRDELEPMVAQLREALQTRTEDARGFMLLAQNEARLGNFAEAIAAQERVITLQGDASTLDDLVFKLDLMVLATGGIVSPEAEAVIEQILRADPQNGVALYFSGRMFAQTGRPDLTFRVWRRLHDVSAGDDPWMVEIRNALPELARISGEPRFTLPPRPAPRGALAGPTEADIEAAADLSPEDRAAMIGGMVDGLMARLANDGGTAEDWAQLLRALAVLDRRDQALDILQEARTVFAARSEDLAIINDAAQAAGLSVPAP
ncbi:MAG: c-type cytochrome biogenesis protein CcmI [Roseinatronobacter sp.]